MSYRLASKTLAVALSSSLLLLSVGAGMSVAASPTTPVKPSIQGGGPGGGGDEEKEENDENEGNERAEHEENEGPGTGGGLVNKAKPVTKAKKPVVKPLTKPVIKAKKPVVKPMTKPVVKPLTKASAKPKVASA